MVKRASCILLSILLIFTNTSVYSRPEHLAADSLIKLWEKKGIDVKKGFIVTERLRAIHKGISQDRRTPDDLRAIDRETVQRHTDLNFLREYPFDYNLISYTDNRIIGMKVDIYKKKGKQQLVLFYDPDTPPRALLREFGVKTDEDMEFARRGFWITNIETPPDSPDPVRRAIVVALASSPLSYLLSLLACVMDVSGVPPTKGDGGLTPDAGPQPINTIEQEIETTVDNTNNPVTILHTSTYTSEDTTQRLSPLPQFVRSNNAAFRYNGRDWHWVLSESDRANIIDNGFTYVFNGRNHKIKLIGENNTGQTKTIIFNPQLPGAPNYDQPYRITISPVQIAQLAEQIGLNPDTINIYFENLEPENTFILNGIQPHYAVIAQTGLVEPTAVGTPWANISTPGANSTTTITPQGTLLISYQIEAGDNSELAGVTITPLVSSENNIAPESTVSASSSYQPSPGYEPENAVDGIIGEMDNGEWGSNGELTPWLRLDWGEPKTIHKIVLYDRPNLLDHITDSVLEFSDGTTVPVGELPDDGSPKVITFPPKTITWVRFQVLSAAPTSQNVGLSEIQAFESVLVPQALPEILRSNTKSASAFILRLLSGARTSLDILITGVNPDTMRGVLVNIQDAINKTKSDFNPSDTQGVSIIIPDYLIPEAISEERSETEIDGLVAGTGTRLEYAHSDPDLTPEDYTDIASRLSDATWEKPYEMDGANVFEITAWPGILTPDGLNFQIGNRRFSAFHIGNKIYIPHIESAQLKEALAKRKRIILEHELHEIKKWTHKDAVLTEFEESINGLNFADIVTILLRVLINNDVQTIDINFHRLFIAELLRHGMPLSLNTYSRILKETLDIDISAETYDSIIREYADAVITYIGEKGIHSEGISPTIDANKLQNEPGYNEFQSAIQSQSQLPQGTIAIELDRFFVKNTTLSDAVAIDTEYFRRFIHFAKLLSPNVHLTGVTSKPEDDITIRQLVSLLRQHLSNFQVSYNIDFPTYQSAQNTVSILTEESAKAIKSPGESKIISPLLSDYNRVTTTWQEFRIALEGIEKTKQDFMNLVLQIAEALLSDLVAKKQITEGNKERLLEEIRQKGIGYIPVYFDPIQYYRSIEQMKSLLTSA